MNWVRDRVLQIIKLSRKLLKSIVILNLKLWKLKVIQMLNICMMKEETEIETGTEEEIGIEKGLLPGKIYSETGGGKEEIAEKETEIGIETGLLPGKIYSET